MPVSEVSAAGTNVLMTMKTNIMKYSFVTLCLSLFLLASCDENPYDRHSETSEIHTDDTLSGFQTGPDYEPIADPNAANTKRDPVPLEPVAVDTSSAGENDNR